AIWSVAHLAADLECPARIGILLGRLGRFVRPDLVSRLACLDGIALAVGVALLGCRYQRSINDLARHRDVTLLVQLPVKGLHDPLERASLGHAVAEMADGVFIWSTIAQGKPQEPHPTQAITD